MHKKYILDGKYGHEDIAIGIPAMLGQSGVIEVIERDMTEAEQNHVRQFCLAG